MASKQPPRLTILFSTHNGASTLPHMLDALERLEAPAGGWKLVAVDNASTDDSATILQERASRLPLTVLSEPRLGKSVALNTGLAAVEGDLVVLTDDDVTPHPQWLAAWRRLADDQPDYDIFGGAIEPVWPAPPAAWILKDVPKGFFAGTDFKEGPAAPHEIWGPNMVVRRSVLDRISFNDGIGPNGTMRYATGAETEFVMRAVKAGHRCWHAPDIVVGHLIEPRQLTEQWILQRAFNHARGFRRLHSIHYPLANECSAPPRRVILRAIKILMRLCGSIARGQSQDRFKAMIALKTLEGDWIEWRFQRRRLMHLHDGATRIG